LILRNDGLLVDYQAALCTRMEGGLPVGKRRAA
jgi:hypothetical protein